MAPRLQGQETRQPIDQSVYPVTTPYHWNPRNRKGDVYLALLEESPIWVLRIHRPPDSKRHCQKMHTQTQKSEEALTWSQASPRLPPLHTMSVCTCLKETISTSDVKQVADEIEGLASTTQGE